MIVDLCISKCNDSDKISILPKDQGDNERVIDVMQYLCVEHENEETVEEFLHTYSVVEVEMIRDFLTSTLNTHYKIVERNKIAERNKNNLDHLL